MSKLPSAEEFVLSLGSFLKLRFMKLASTIRERDRAVLKAAADVAYEHCSWEDRRAVGDKILKLQEEPSPRPARSRFAKGDIVTFEHKGIVKRGEVVEVDTEDEAAARLTVWLQGIWVRVHPDHCVREE